MNRLAAVEPQYQGAGERLVIRVIRNDHVIFLIAMSGGSLSLVQRRMP
jgi:hypothetical protein